MIALRRHGDAHREVLMLVTYIHTYIHTEVFTTALVLNLDKKGEREAPVVSESYRANKNKDVLLRWRNTTQSRLD